MNNTNNKFGTCRNCNARILWIKTVNGKNMPVNPQIIDYKIVKGGKERIVTEEGKVIVGEKAEHNKADGYGYISHFATCPSK